MCVQWTRKNLLPLVKKAKDDNKDHVYIRYNKLIVDGREYTGGKYGHLPKEEPEGELKICVWNCNVLTRQTGNNDEFTSISTFELESYKYSNFNRTFQHKHVQKNCVGVAMFCSLDIIEGVNVIRNHFDTLIWVKLDKVLLNLDEDIYLCSAYVWVRIPRHTML